MRKYAKKTLNDFFSKWWEFLLLAERLKTTTTTSQWPTLATSTCSRPTPRYSDYLFFFCVIILINVTLIVYWLMTLWKFHFRESWCSKRRWSAIPWMWLFGSLATMQPLQWVRYSSSLTTLSWSPLLQEDLTGMDTGMKDYLTLNHPDLLDKLTPNYYDEIFVVPWATNRQFEKFNTLIQNDSMSSSWWPNWRINENNHFFGRREVEETHKDLLQSVGKTLRGEQWEHLNWKFKKNWQFELKICG